MGELEVPMVLQHPPHRGGLCDGGQQVEDSEAGGGNLGIQRSEACV